MENGSFSPMVRQVQGASPGGRQQRLRLHRHQRSESHGAHAAGGLRTNTQGGGMDRDPVVNASMMIVIDASWFMMSMQMVGQSCLIMVHQWLMMVNC